MCISCRERGYVCKKWKKIQTSAKNYLSSSSHFQLFVSLRYRKRCGGAWVLGCMCHLVSFNLQKINQEWTEGILARRRLYGDEDDCCQKPVKNYFHLTPKIGPLWGGEVYCTKNWNNSCRNNSCRKNSCMNNSCRNNSCRNNSWYVKKKKKHDKGDAREGEEDQLWFGPLIIYLNGFLQLLLLLLLLLLYEKILIRVDMDMKWRGSQLFINCPIFLLNILYVPLKPPLWLFLEEQNNYLVNIDSLLI